MRLFPDAAWAVATIWQEARGEPKAGMIAVGNVIRNRVAKQGKTVAQVVLEAYQFSGWNTTDPNRLPAALIDDSDPVVKRCVDAWVVSESDQLVQDATLYVNLDKVMPAWITAPGVVQIVQIGHHTFFAERPVTA